MNSYASMLESYSIIDDTDLIAVESCIYTALESNSSITTKLKSSLNKLARAKANNDKEEIREAKQEVDENIDEINDQAQNETDNTKKNAMKKVAKIGGVIAATVATAATIAVAANKLKNKNSFEVLTDEEVKALGLKTNQKLMQIIDVNYREV